jgi:hypothetical protein
MKNELTEKQKRIAEYKSELHSLREQTKKDIEEKGKTIHSLQNKLCVQRQEEKEACGKISAIIKVRFAYTQ